MSKRKKKHVVVAVVSIIAVTAIAGAASLMYQRSAGDARPPIVALINHSTASDQLFFGQFCGGVIVESDEVVTASHCVRGRAPETMDVLFGVTDLCGGDSRGGERVQVNAISSVPDAPWLSTIHLARPLRSKFDTPASTRGDVPLSTQATAWGWGRTAVAGVPSCNLREVRLVAIDPERCAREIHNLGGTKPQSHLCTEPAAGVNTCDGDSGGPVLIYRDGRIVETFVTMSGEGCGPKDSGLNVLIPFLGSPDH